jgi:hypothetical protein
MEPCDAMAVQSASTLFFFRRLFMHVLKLALPASAISLALMATASAMPVTKPGGAETGLSQVWYGGGYRGYGGYGYRRGYGYRGDYGYRRGYGYYGGYSYPRGYGYYGGPVYRGGYGYRRGYAW